MKNKLIVFSADAMVFEDLAYLKTLPNYQKYLSEGSIVEKVRTIYPTLTYPVHVSITSGTFPNRHGVCSNYKFDLGNLTPPWNWFHDSVKVPDLYTLAKKHGKTTASVFWPVTGNHPDIDFLIAEYWTQNNTETIHEAFKRAGSSDSVLEIVDANKEKLIERTHPKSDEFIISCACDMITKFKPDLLTIHTANIDAYRHKYGVFNQHVNEGIEETDRWIGELMEATKRAKTFDETNLFVISDHGQLDIRRVIQLNVLLAEAGFIDVDKSGNIVDWQAYSLSGGMSTLIYLKNPHNRQIEEQVYNYLVQLCKKGLYGFSEVYTEKEINAQERLGGDFSFVLETDGYSSFGDNWVLPVVTNFDYSDYRFGRATHGYLPAKGPQPVLLANGPQIGKNIVLPECHIVDEASTFARVLGFEFPDTDGSPIEKILIT